MSRPTSAYPALAYSNSPELEQARHDRVLVDYGAIELRGTQQAFDEFAEALATHEVVLPDGTEAFLFARRSGLHWTIRRRDVCDQSQSTNYLFTGSIRAWRHGSNVWRIRAELALNPTRYVRYQAISGQDQDWTQFPPRLTGGEDPWTNNREYPILDADNFVHGAGRVALRWSPARWPTHLSRYISAVTELVVSCVRTAAYWSGLNVETIDAVQPQSYPPFFARVSGTGGLMPRA